jgi:Holliday junction DNA helicase RuvA
MAKFALMVTRGEDPEADIVHDIFEETYQILCSLGHSESDARRLLETPLHGKKKFKDVESLLQAVYQNVNG